MLCQRCEGRLVRETCSDLREVTGCLSPAMRCINCGYFEDSVVRANRILPLAEKRPVPRGMVRRGRSMFINTHSGGY
jgi:hypothetical protein